MMNNRLNASAILVREMRTNNINASVARLSGAEKESLLKNYHPDSAASEKIPLRIGVNRGDLMPHELARLLEGKSRISASEDSIDLKNPKIHADVLIIGCGGAGAAAAIEAARAGARTVLVTKLRPGDSNTVMAEGGIQAVTEEDDTPALHFLDTFGGGHFAAKRDLVRKMVLHGPETLQWLLDLGVSLDRCEDGRLQSISGGGTSRRRIHACRDLTGTEIMQTLQDEILNRQIPVIPYTAAIELLTDGENRCCGAILEKTKTGERMVAVAKTVILATGGSGRIHCQGFPTSNHYGATADGLVIAYRAGAKLRDADSLQYHPTGAAYPQHMGGILISEKARALGAKLLNREGKPFVNSLETRDVCTAAILRECHARKLGISAGGICGVWLDIPMIDRINGQGTIESGLPSVFRRYRKAGIDIREEPIVVYPTLHYQNGGIDISDDGMTGVENLYACGEVTGGIHGRNRLMGNSLLDIIVFGRASGMAAAEKAKTITKEPTPTLSHLIAFEKERKENQIIDSMESPILLPDYRIHSAMKSIERTPL